MTAIEWFGLAVLVAALVGLAAVFSHRLSEWVRIPAPAIFLVGAALASDLWPALGKLSVDTVEQIVTLALAVILFDGGMHIGWRRFRPTAAATVWLGVAGTLVTAGAVAVCAHALFGLDWRAALLVGTALAPTDPAVVFSVLGGREIAGRTGTLLEGESGANDPVGIALMTALLAAHGAGLAAAGTVAAQFGLQMVMGIVIGVAGARALLWLMRRLSLPYEGLYPLRVLAGALAIYGAATAAGGSGFLAVFVAGILIGDEPAPFRGDIRRFHSALSSLAEIVAFILLGLTVRLADLPHRNTWLIGLGLAGLLVFAIRPLLVGLVLWPIRLRLTERVFVLWTGLRGAVPILLGVFILNAEVSDATRLYEIIFVVVAFSVIVQGGLVPTMARQLKIPLQRVELEPWSLGVRLRHQPEAIQRHRIAPGSPADGRRLVDLQVGDDAWISLIIRNGHLVPIRADTRLHAGDEVLTITEPGQQRDLDTLFQSPRDKGDDKRPGQPDEA